MSPNCWDSGRSFGVFVPLVREGCSYVIPPDPYRWLENLNTPEVTAWVEAKNELTFDYLEALPRRETMKERLTAFWNYFQHSLPDHRGGRAFWTENSGLKNHSVLYVRDEPNAEPRVLIDPNTFSGDGTVSMSMYAAPPDGALFAPNTEHQLFYHRVGTPQPADVLILRSEEHPNAIVGAQVTDDGRYVLVHQYKTSQNRSFVLDLGDPMDPNVEAQLAPLFTGFDASRELIGSNGSTAYILTNKGAPFKRIIAVDLDNPATGNWSTVIPEAAKARSVVNCAELIGDRFVVERLEDAQSARWLATRASAASWHVLRSWVSDPCRGSITLRSLPGAPSSTIHASRPHPSGMQREMADRGTFLVGTDFHFDNWYAYGMDSTAAQEMYRRVVDRLRRAHALGVPLAFGSDIIIDLPGMNRVETGLRILQTWKDAGIPPMDALRALTYQAAALLGLQGERGRVAPGHRADLIALPKSPLDDLGHLREIYWVMKDGVVVRDEVP